MKLCFWEMSVQLKSTVCFYATLAGSDLLSGSHLVKAGEGGADLPDGREGMDLMSEESWGRSVERERDVWRSIVGRWSAERDLL